MRRRVLMKGTTANRLYLFNNGDECTDVTGGWRAQGLQTNTTRTRVSVSNNQIIVAVVSGSGEAANTISTVLPIDAGKYSTLHIIYSGTFNRMNGGYALRCTKKCTNANSTASAFEAWYGAYSAVSAVDAIDERHSVYDLNDVKTALGQTSFYMVALIQRYSGNVTGELRVKEIYLER